MVLPGLIFTRLCFPPLDVFIVIDDIPLLFDREFGQFEITSALDGFEHRFNFLVRFWAGEVESVAMVKAMVEM